MVTKHFKRTESKTDCLRPGLFNRVFGPPEGGTNQPRVSPVPTVVRRQTLVASDVGGEGNSGSLPSPRMASQLSRVANSTAEFGLYQDRTLLLGRVRSCSFRLNSRVSIW
jgi:hypothetical protein